MKRIEKNGYPISEMMLGTVAGDDTIIVVTRSIEESQALCDSIEEQRR